MQASMCCGDDLYAIGDECSHADFSLAEGDVWADECEIECPKHGSTFSLATGQPQTLPATQPVEWFRLQQEVELWELQHVIPGANSGCRGAAYDAQNAVSANTARMTRPLKRNYDITSP